MVGKYDFKENSVVHLNLDFEGLSKYAYHKGASKYYIIRLGGLGGLNQNYDSDDAFRGRGGLGLK